jgi:tetratricopeptide (TPR) repeat protein
MAYPFFDIYLAVPHKHPSRRGFAKIAIVAGIAVLAIAGFAGLFAWLMTGNTEDPTLRLNAGLRLLKNSKPREALSLVVSLSEKQLVNAGDQAKQGLILGAAALDESEKLEAPRFIYNKSVEAEEHLSKANKLGFPRGYEGFGNFLLGKVLYQLFRWDEAAPALDLAIAEWPSGRVESLERLVDIELDRKPIDRDMVAKRLEQWDGMAGLTDEERNLARIKEIEFHIASNDLAEGEVAAIAFPTNSVYHTRANYLLALARLKAIDLKPPVDMEASLQQVLDGLVQVLRNPNTDWGTRRRAQYYLGTVQARAGRPKAALATLNVLHQQAPDSIEGVMASLEEMRILLDQNQYEEVAKTVRQIKEQFGKLEWYRNAWVSFDELRTRVNKLGRGLLEKEAFAEAIAFAEQQPPFCNRSDYLQLLSQATRRWAESLKGQSAKREVLMDIRNAQQSRVQYDDMNQQQQSLYSRSAKAFEELAIVEIRTPNHHDYIWSAIDCSQAAGELAYCNSMITNAMNYESRDDHPRSLIKMAENHFAMQQPDKALSLLNFCIEQHPDHPLCYNARLNASRILNDMGEFEKAVEKLDENLYLGSLTPDSAVWRESLFELGKSMYRRGELLYGEAERFKDEFAGDSRAKRLEKLEQSHSQFLRSIEHLEHWGQRYPTDSRRFDTLYSVGQAYQMAAQWPRVAIEEKLLPTEELIRAKQAERRSLLDSARKTFKEIRDGMSNTLEWSTLEPSQQHLLRNSYFAEADLMFQAKNFEGALVAYRNIANRLVNEPESLEALVQVAECLRAMGRNEESAGVVAQAREVLQQIPAQREPLFTSSTRFSRDGWTKHLDWMTRNKL